MNHPSHSRAVLVYILWEPVYISISIDFFCILIYNTILHGMWYWYNFDGLSDNIHPPANIYYLFLLNYTNLQSNDLPYEYE